MALPALTLYLDLIENAYTTCLVQHPNRQNDLDELAIATIEIWSALYRNFYGEVSLSR